MAYIIQQHPMIRLDIMVPQKYWAEVVGMIDRAGCTYAEEECTEPMEGRPYYVLRDIQAKNGHDLGEFLGLLYGLEWKVLTDVAESNDAKFYIMIHPRMRKKEKKNHAEEVREKVHPGSESGNRGESTGDIRPGEASAACGDGDCAGGPGDSAALGQT